ncbi:hypothetical protein ACOJBM_36640 [Rhizobium beringeri]
MLDNATAPGSIPSHQVFCQWFILMASQSLLCSRIHGLSPSLYRLVIEPVQPHIRSPFSTAGTNFPLSRARAQENGTNLKTGS